MVRAIRGVEDPGAQGFPDLAAVFAELERLDGEVAALPARRHAQARFFLAVRRAEVRLRQGRLDDAARIGADARRLATLDGVWKGSYRALLIVLLEQCVDEAARAALLAAERSYLESDTATADAPWLAVPLAVLRAEVALQSGRDGEGMQGLAAAADRALAELPRDDPRRVGALSRLGWELVVRGDHDRAEIYLKELPADLARYPRGIVALRRGDYDLALRAGRALERTGRAIDGLQLQGEALERSGRPADAQPVYRRLLEVARDPLAKAIALRSLADTERALAGDEPAVRLQAAERLYRDALDAAAGSGRHAAAESVQILAALGETLEQLGRADAARDAFAASVARIDAARRTLAVDPFGASFLREPHLRAIEGLLRLWPPGADAAAALALVEIGKARTLLDWTRAPPRAGGEVARAVRDLVLSNDPAAVDARLRELEDARRGGGGSRVADVRPLDAPAIRAQLAAEPATVVVSYWLGDGRLYAVTGTGVHALADAATALDGLRRARRAVLDVGHDPTAELRAAADVFLPAGLRAELAGAARVVICPDERLGRLPFEALPLGDGVALGLAIAVERAPSLSVRAVLASRTPRGAARVLVVSEVEAADAERELGLAPLAFSARERELVERAYGASRVTSLRGTAATRDALRDALAAGAVDLLHVSAHVVEDRRLPTASVLVLADGPVALPSLCAVDLDGAFVVLSACSSGTGEERGGEGDLGLLGWPVAAGARGAVASLWPVGQQATTDLMGQFHAFRSEGLDPADALRRARQVLAAAPQYAHPFHWAGFAAFAPERRAASPGLWTWLGAGGVGLCVAFGVSRARTRRARPGGQSQGSS